MTILPCSPTSTPSRGPMSRPCSPNLIRASLQELIEAEATGALSAGRYERTDSRTTHRRIDGDALDRGLDPEPTGPVWSVARSGTATPPPRPLRRPYPVRESDRTAESSVSRLRPEPDLAGSRATGLRSARRFGGDAELRPGRGRPVPVAGVCLGEVSTRPDGTTRRPMRGRRGRADGGRFFADVTGSS